MACMAPITISLFETKRAVDVETRRGDREKAPSLDPAGSPHRYRRFIRVEPELRQRGSEALKTLRRVGKIPPSGDRGDVDVTERQDVTRHVQSRLTIVDGTPSKRTSGITRSIMTIGRGKFEIGGSKYMDGGPVGAG